MSPGPSQLSLPSLAQQQPGSVALMHRQRRRNVALIQIAADL